nr:hypothetical protein [Tanacetum cinerariifolium]
MFILRLKKQVMKFFQANHSIQNEESFENPSNEIDASNPNQEKEEPPQESDMHQLIKECSTKAYEEQKQSIEDTMLELVKICQEKEFLCIHDNVDDLIESALNSKHFLINSNSQHLDKKEQEVKNVVEQPAEHGNRRIQSLQNFRVVHKSSISYNTSQTSLIHAITPVLSTKEPEHSLRMRYEHLSITPTTESDEVTESNAENLLPILSECEVTLEDKRECDVPISENSPVCDNHSDIFFDSKINDDISVYDDDFEDIEYVEASLPDPEIVNIEEENVGQQEEEEVDLEDISQIQDVVLREKLLSITRLISNIESLNDNSTPNCVLNSFESDNSLTDNFSLELETFCDPSEETRSEEANLFLASDNLIPSGIENIADDSEGDIRFLEELLIDDFILSHQSSDSNFEDNPSIPRPPSELPDAKTDAEEEIPVVMINKDKFDEDYHFFMFAKVFSFLSAESEDTIFDPGCLDSGLSSISSLEKLFSEPIHGILNFSRYQHILAFNLGQRDDTTAHGDDAQEPSIPSPTPPTPPPQPPQDLPSTSQRVDTSEDTVMDDASNQGRIIDKMDKDDVVALMDDKEEDKKEEEAKVVENDQVQGRQA